jgi:hypothetical protein
LDLNIMQIKAGRKWSETVGHGGRLAKAKTASSAWDEGGGGGGEEEKLNNVGAGCKAYCKGLSQNFCGGLRKNIEKCGRGREGGAASGSTIATHECIAYPASAVRQAVCNIGRCNTFQLIRRMSEKWNEQLCRDYCLIFE